MRQLWIFLHLLGFVMWLGGGLAAMFAGIAARRLARNDMGTAARLLAAIHLRVVGPGAALVVISGVVLTLRLMSALGAGMSGALSPWLMPMQGAGLLGAALVLVVSVPAASRLQRIDPAANAAAFDALRSRLRLTGAVAGVLGLLAIVSGALLG